MMKIIYFGVRGVIENSRIMLHIAGVEFDDHRLALTMKAGGGYDTSAFDALKLTGECVANMDRLPILVVDGVSIGQSKAIDRYVAKKCHMLGNSDLEAAQIDCIAEHVRDIKDKYQKVKAMPAAEKEEGLKKWFASDLGELLVKLEKSLPASRSAGFSVGSATSYADVTIWSFLTEYFDDNSKVTDALSSCTGLQAIVAAVSNLETLKAYLAVRPVTPM